jgi:NTP pyrophosphatase (non-canonical NTP hydrolase)
MRHERLTVDTVTQVNVLTQVGHQLGVRIAKHGPESFIGPHETLGILWEEFAELCDAVRANDTRQVRAELMDIAVAAVFGMASQDEQPQDEQP